MHRAHIPTSLLWAVSLLSCFALIASANALNWRPLANIDDRGDSMQSWALDVGWLHEPLELVERLFDTTGMTIATFLFAVLAWFILGRAEAITVVAVMVVTAVATSALKAVFGRSRPQWQNPDDLLESMSFPSGHASAVTAFAILAAGLVIGRHIASRARPAGWLVLTAVVAVVCLDRLLLGRHYPSDVVAGACLGGAIALLGLTICASRGAERARGERDAAGA